MALADYCLKRAFCVWKLGRYLNRRFELSVSDGFLDAGCLEGLGLQVVVADEDFDLPDGLGKRLLG